MPEKAFARSVVHVIDDDEAALESLSFLLRSADLEVRSYLSAQAFFDALPGSTSSCVVTDVRMPDMSASIIAAFEEAQDRGTGNRDCRPWRRCARGRGDEDLARLISSKNRSTMRPCWRVSARARAPA